MAKYTKKRITIEAYEMAQARDTGMEQWPKWLVTAFRMQPDQIGSVWIDSKGHMLIGTLEGALEVSRGDYIIKGIRGELYPCKPDIFEASYDKTLMAEPAQPIASVEDMILQKGLVKPRVTPQDVEDAIAKVAFYVFPDTCLTVCNLTLTNGFSTVGYSACVHPENFDQEIGETVAFRNAKNEIWVLLGFRLQDELKATVSK